MSFMAGTYIIPNPGGSPWGTLTITDGTTANSLNATIELTLDGQYTIHTMALTGSFTKYNQQGSANEHVFLVTLQGHGSVADINGNARPGTFAMTGFMNDAAHTPVLTSQWAAAYEIYGNAEEINGDHRAWVKQSVGVEAVRQTKKSYAD